MSELSGKAAPIPCSLPHPLPPLPKGEGGGEDLLNDLSIIREQFVPDGHPTFFLSPSPYGREGTEGLLDHLSLMRPISPPHPVGERVLKDYSIIFRLCALSPPLTLWERGY